MNSPLNGILGFPQPATPATWSGPPTPGGPSFNTPSPTEQVAAAAGSDPYAEERAKLQSIMAQPVEPPAAVAPAPTEKSGESTNILGKVLHYLPAATDRGIAELVGLPGNILHGAQKFMPPPQTLPGGLPIPGPSADALVGLFPQGTDIRRLFSWMTQGSSEVKPPVSDRLGSAISAIGESAPAAGRNQIVNAIGAVLGSQLATASPQFTDKKIPFTDRALLTGNPEVDRTIGYLLPKTLPYIKDILMEAHTNPVSAIKTILDPFAKLLQNPVTTLGRVGMNVLPAYTLNQAEQPGPGARQASGIIRQ